MKYVIAFALVLSICGCAQQQSPVRVVSVKPTVKRTPPKKTTTAQMQTAYSKPAKQQAKGQQAPSTPSKISNKSNDTINWAWPAKGGILTRFSANQTFKGIDIGGTEGTAVFAASDGEVVYSGDSLRGYGNLIIIKHNKNFITAYAHNRKNMVKEGERVKLGQRIAEMGQTGTDKVKLHFEVRYQGKPIDPQEVLPAR